MSRYIKQDQQPTNNFTIRYDDREKDPWFFLEKYWTLEKTRLKTGDYTIVGHEKSVAIEKKSGIGEILMDLTAAKRPAFERFLKRLAKYPVKCIVVEEELTNDNIYRALAVQKKKSKGKSKLTANTIFYWTSVITIEYNIPIEWMDKTTARNVLPHMFQMAYNKVRRLENGGMGN